MKYNIVKIQQYIRGLMRDVKLEERVKLDYTITQTYLILHLYFPERTQLQDKQIRELTDNDVMIRFYSSFYCSVEFPILLNSQEEVNEMKRQLE